MESAKVDNFIIYFMGDFLRQNSYKMLGCIAFVAGLGIAHKRLMVITSFYKKKAYKKMRLKRTKS